MDEIVSLVVANGLWAVLFCGLLVYELRDSRSRESKYTQTIRTLSERLGTVAAIKSDTTEIKRDVEKVATDIKSVRADTATVKKTVAVCADGKRRAGGAECAKNPA